MTQLIPTEPKSLTEWQAPEGGWASDGNEDIPPAFPIVSILQPMSQVPNAVAGWFHHSDTEEIVSDFDGVLMVRRETRALFVKGDEKPVCRSDDAKVPAPRMRLWAMEPGERITTEQGEFGVPLAPKDCASCPFSQWRGEWGDEPPICGNAYVIIAARNGDPEDLVQLRLKGTSIKPFRDWVRRKLAPRNLPMYAFQVHLTTEEHTAPTRKWYQLAIQSAPLAKDDAMVFHHVILAHRARIEQAVKEAGGEVAEWIEDDDPPFE